VGGQGSSRPRGQQSRAPPHTHTLPANAHLHGGPRIRQAPREVVAIQLREVWGRRVQGVAVGWAARHPWNLPRSTAGSGAHREAAQLAVHGEERRGQAAGERVVRQVPAWPTREGGGERRWVGIKRARANASSAADVHVHQDTRQVGRWVPQRRRSQPRLGWPHAHVVPSARHALRSAARARQQRAAAAALTGVPAAIASPSRARRGAGAP
jgi:hypothetical protein